MTEPQEPQQSPQQYSVAEFAAKIRERRPDLSNVSDADLVNKTLEAAPELRSFLKPEAPPPESPGSRFMTSFAQGIDPSAGIEAAVHPVDTAKALVGASLSHYDEFKKAISEGRNNDAADHLMGMMPLIGPQVAGIKQKFATGDVAGGMGDLSAALLPFALHGAKMLTGTSEDLLNPVQRAAVEFGKRESVPLAPSVRTGSKFAKQVETHAGSLPGSSAVMSRARNAGQGALADLGGKLTLEASPGVTAVSDAEQAGKSLVTGLEAKVRRFGLKADDAYTELRQIEADPANTRSVQVGTQQQRQMVTSPTGAMAPGSVSVPVMKDIAIPVDLRGAKAALQPIYEEIQKVWPLTKQQSSPGFAALKNLMDSEDYVSASTAEKNLSSLKAITRGSEGPGLRNKSQGIAAKAINELQDSIDDAVTNAPAGGQDAIAALSRGRALTAAKYGVKDLLGEVGATFDDKGKLQYEPVNVFNRLTRGKDGSVELLKSVRAQAPQEMQRLGQAFLEGLIEKGRTQGGFTGTDSIFSTWNNLGDSTKQILFKNPALRAKIDNFFQLAKQVNASPNPSGSGATAMISMLGAATVLPLIRGDIMGAAESAAGITGLAITANGLARLLMSPAGSAALEDFLRASKPGVVAGALSKTAAAAKLLNLLRPDETVKVGENEPLQPGTTVKVAQLPQ
jgi:hypothetical protein